MILEFELDDAAFGQAVTEKIVNETFGRKLFDGYSPMGAQVAETIRQEVRDIIRAREDEIVDRVVDTATDRIVGRLTAPRKDNMDLKGKRVYIAGKITGLAGYQYKFADAEYRLNHTYGADAVNPARVNAELPRETTYRQYWRMCQMMLCDCDAILMLDNWKDSPGATAEYYAAKANGLAVYFDGGQVIEEEPV